MTVWHKFKIAGIGTVGVALMLAVVPSAICKPLPPQESESESADTAIQNTDYRSKSLGRLRKDFYSAEKDFYTLFNSINSSDEFDVDCKDEVPFGSRGKVHACKADFLRKYEAKVASKYDNRLSRIGEDSLPSTSEIDKKQELLRSEISAAVSGNPEMQKLYVILLKAKEDYEAKQRDP